MTLIKAPFQTVCANCSVSNPLGAPYCSRCGAPIGKSPHPQPATSKISSKAAPASSYAEPYMRFVTDDQDATLVKQIYEKASIIMMNEEEVEYIGVGHKGVGHTPDCVVATSKRCILYRKKVLGKLELDDCFWRDVHDAQINPARHGVALILIQSRGGG